MKITLALMTSSLVPVPQIGKNIIELWYVVFADINRLIKTKYTHSPDHANSNKKTIR